MGHCSASFLLASSIFFPQYVPGHMRCVVLVSPYSDVQTNKKIKIQHKIQRWPNLCASVLVSSSIHSTFSFIRFSFIRVLVFFFYLYFGNGMNWTHWREQKAENIQFGLTINIRVHESITYTKHSFIRVLWLKWKGGSVLDGIFEWNFLSCQSKSSQGCKARGNWRTP